MTESPTKVHSPLEGLVYKDGLPMELRIYKLPESLWRLELVDDHGRAAVWRQEFESDQEAYDEAIRSISKEEASWLIVR